MVAGSLQGHFQTIKHPPAIMFDHGSFTMHQTVSPHNFTTVYLANGLMAQTHAQDRDFRSKLTDHLTAYPCFVRTAGTR